MTNFSTLFSPISVTIANIAELKNEYQTLIFNESNQNLSIVNGNTVSLSSLAGGGGTGREDVNTLVIENSANWNQAYDVATAYQTISSSFATSTVVDDVSSLLTPLVLTNTLTSQLVTNTNFANYQTNVANITATLLPTSIYQSASGNWQEAYTNLATNSAAYLSGVDLTFLQEPSANWNSTHTTVQNNSANWQEAYNTATVYQSNSSSYATTSFVSDNFFPLSGGTISGPTRINNNLTVFGNLTATGTTTFANTIFSVTSALSVVHIGSGPAIWVGNNGDGDIASFYDIDNGVEVLHVGGNNGTFPNVGVKTSEPNKDFTVKGELSASGTIYEGTGNSNQWNEAYTNLTTNSAAYLSSVDLTFLSVSGNWNQAYDVATAYQLISSSFATNTSLNSVSSLLTPLTLTNSLTSQLVANTNFTNYQTSVAASTATLLPTTIYQNASGNWQSTFTTVQTNSASWGTGSGDGSTIDTEVRALTGNWQSTYTTVQSNSASWVNSKTIAQFTAIDNQPLSANFATLDTRISIAVLDFDDTTTESACFVGVIPEGTNLSSGLQVRLHWAASTATTGDVDWGVQFMNLNTPLSADSFDTAAFEITTTSNTLGLPSTTTITCTTLNGMTAGSFYRMRVFRDSADTVNDTMAGDAELIAVEIRSTA